MSEINREHLNPRHLTEDLARRLGGMDKVPRLFPNLWYRRQRGLLANPGINAE
jgi:hypothetical protein